MQPTSFAPAPRAAHLVEMPSALVQAHTLCQADAYEREINPHGYINFGTAENYLLWDLLAPALSAPRPLTPSDTHYGPMYGSDKFRRLLTQFLQRRTQRKLDPEALVVAGGASAVIDMVAWVLFNPGEGILVASPNYPGFDFDLEARARLKLVSVPTHASDGFVPSIAHLQKAYDGAHRRGIQVRGMVIANPHNPTGGVAAPEHMRAWMQFARDHQLEVLVDEIYAHSVYGPATFVSCLQEPMPHVHMIYGLAKDFALSGFKIGMVYSENVQVIRALQTLAYFSPVSSDTQATVCTLLENTPWVDQLLRENQRRLAQASAATAQAVTRMGGAVHPGQAGVFLWISLRAFLSEDTFAAEASLHQALLHGARVNLSPGAVFHCTEPGWFRLCFASEADTLQAGLQRLASALAAPASRPSASRTQAVALPM